MPTNKLVLHQHTAAQTAQFAARPAQAVLLVGADGIGKRQLALHLAAQALGKPAATLDTNPYVRIVSPESSATISIDDIRALQHFLQLKTIGTQPIRRAAIIEHSNQLTTDAQNAFLKMLEEPPADTLLLLTANSPRALLPTTMSRVQVITVYPPDAASLQTHFTAAGHAAADVQRAYFMSGGLPGLMQALLDDDSSHPLPASAALAKELLQKQTFERLTLVESLSKQKDASANLVDALLRISRIGLATATAKQDAARIKQWHHVMHVAHDAQTALAASANAKLALTSLMLAL